MSVITFWGNDHPLSAKNDELFEALVPPLGNCPSVQGEMLRAASKIGYDWFNNGWGCNNWSGAVLFIQKNYHLFPNKPDQCFVDELMKALDWVHGYSHGETCRLKYDGKACKTVTKIQEIIVNTILANPEPIANVTDMYDLTERSNNW